MSARRAKTDLPEKVCPSCDRPFRWRKKWERNWEDVVYCSRRCRGKRRPQQKAASPGATQRKSQGLSANIA